MNSLNEDTEDNDYKKNNKGQSKKSGRYKKIIFNRRYNNLGEKKIIEQ